ncbi:MAG: hypothetical protein RBR06_06215 [Desulfuromonadaceae bacterium]|nr:hypothetical protein [Desulfuromonadaceae bacterium]
MHELIPEETLEMYAGRFISLRMQRLLCITFAQYLAAPDHYEAMLNKVVQRKGALNICNGVSRLVAV